MDPDHRTDDFDPIYAEIAVAIPNPKSAVYLTSQLGFRKLSKAKIPSAAEHIARYGIQAVWSQGLIALLRNEYTPEIGEGLIGFLRALQSRGEKLDASQRSQVLELVEREIFANATQANPDNVKRISIGAS